MRRIYCLLIMLCIIGRLFGQDKNMVVAGIQVADIRFNHVLNYKATSSRLKAFSKKVVVINFWTSSCGACLKKIPVLDSMQKAYADELSVLLVSSSKGDTKERVYKAFERIRDNTGRAVGLPVILGDSLLKKHFPHQYVPHFVILDSRLKLLGVSDNEEMTAASLAAIIKTGKAAFTAKQRIQEFDPKRLLFTDESSLAGVMVQSTLSRYLPGTPSTSYITKDSNRMVTRILLTNQSIKELLKRACHYFDYPDLTRWGEGSESRMNPAERTSAWVRANSYTYQLVCEPMPYDSARHIMLQDIERVLGYTAAVRDTVGERYVLKLKHAGQPPAGLLAAAGAEENADVLRLMRYLSRQLKLDVQTKLPNNMCTHINLQQVAGKSFAELEALLAEQGFYFTKEPVKKRTLFIYQLKN